jgi:hypothetical protein
MNCREFWNTLPEPSMPHPHLEECSGCSARMDQLRELAAGLRAVSAGMSRVQAPARVEARLLSAFRAEAGAVPVRTHRAWIPPAAWAGAVAAMIAVGVLVIRDRVPQAGQASPARVTEIASMQTGPDNAESFSEDGFLPLPGAAELPATDDVDLVQVELPRSAMMQVGIAVSPERAEETVRADVMVGADGMARAVRFLDIAGSD